MVQLCFNARMDEKVFESVVAQELDAVPSQYKERLNNVAVIIEDEPGEELLHAQGVPKGETLLGLYQGVPNTVRGDTYGIGMTLPDTITLFRIPILAEAGPNEDEVRKVVRETIWHEIAHYFGYDDPAVENRERQGTNDYLS